MQVYTETGLTSVECWPTRWVLSAAASPPPPPPRSPGPVGTGSSLYVVEEALQRLPTH